MFSYTIRVVNTGTAGAQLISRHWVITDANNKVEEVRGLGAVGHQPLLQPGEQFEYTSGTMLGTPRGSMHGEYFCVAEDGHQFKAPIPSSCCRCRVPCIDETPGACAISVYRCCLFFAKLLARRWNRFLPEYMVHQTINASKKNATSASIIKIHIRTPMLFTRSLVFTRRLLTRGSLPVSVGAVALALSACTTPPAEPVAATGKAPAIAPTVVKPVPAKPADAKPLMWLLLLVPAKFAALPGWARDDMRAARPPSWRPVVCWSSGRTGRSHARSRVR